VRLVDPPSSPRRAARATRQFDATLEVLAGDDRHPTAEQIHLEVGRRLGRSCLATVYRNLRKLVDEGRAAEIAVPGQPARFDGRLDPHDHFLCRSCTSLSDVPREPDPARSRPRLAAPVAERGFRVESWSVLFSGLCDACAAAARTGD